MLKYLVRESFNSIVNKFFGKESYDDDGVE